LTSILVEAVYEKGVLKPLGRLGLREGERVKILVVRGSRGLSETLRRLSREYEGVGEDPLETLLGARR